MEDFKSPMERLEDQVSINVTVKRTNRLTCSKILNTAASKFTKWDLREFKSDYDLKDSKILKRIYTKNSNFFRDLNTNLYNDTGNSVVIQYTILLSRAVYHMTEKLPDVVWRGLDISMPLLFEYHCRIGEIIYFRGFTSASKEKSVAQNFGSWIQKIILKRGNRNCVADVSDVSALPREHEILISANAGFKLWGINYESKVMTLSLVDESRCLR